MRSRRQVHIALMVGLLASLGAGAWADVRSEERRLVELSFDRMLEGQARVAAVAEPMRIAGAELCGTKIAPVLGLYAANRYTFKDLYMGLDHFDMLFDVASERFALGEHPRVLGVVPGLPADQANLEVGDVITSVSGHDAKMKGDLHISRKDVENGIIRLGVLRGEESLDVEVPAVMGCAIPSRFSFGAFVNAYAMSFGDLTGVYFFSGLLNFGASGFRVG